LLRGWPWNRFRDPIEDLLETRHSLAKLGKLRAKIALFSIYGCGLRTHDLMETLMQPAFACMPGTVDRYVQGYLRADEISLVQVVPGYERMLFEFYKGEDAVFREAESQVPAARSGCG